MPDRILFVDDEPNVLEALQRNLRRQFKVSTAVGPEAGLATLEEEGPFAVVVSDYRMPGMNGVHFLARASEVDPDVVRVMLTGHADTEVAIEAVNEGQIFRFLRKPCPNDRLVRAMQEALRHRQLIENEHILLEQTLQGSLRVLSQTLSLTNPAAFGLGARIEPVVAHVARELGLEGAWRYKVAAMISQIGCVTLPNELVEKVYALAELSEEERGVFASHSATGAQLLENIPRLEAIAAMIRDQDSAPALTRPVQAVASSRPELVGAQLLRISIALDRLLHGGMPQREALHQLRTEPDQFTPELLNALDGLDFVEELGPPRTTVVADLLEGMVLDEDVRTRRGVLLISRGHEVTLAVLERLRRLGERGEVAEPFRARVRRTIAKSSVPSSSDSAETRP